MDIMSKTKAQLTNEITELRKRILLDKEGSRSVTVLVEKLRLLNPLAFSIGLRIKSYVQHIATKLDLPNAWEFEVAAMLSQTGTLPSGITKKQSHQAQEISRNPGIPFGNVLYCLDS